MKPPQSEINQALAFCRDLPDEVWDQQWELAGSRFCPQACKPLSEFIPADKARTHDRACWEVWDYMRLSGEAALYRRESEAEREAINSTLAASPAMQAIRRELGLPPDRLASGADFPEDRIRIRKPEPEPSPEASPDANSPPQPQPPNGSVSRPKRKRAPAPSQTLTPEQRLAEAEALAEREAIQAECLDPVPIDQQAQDMLALFGDHPVRSNGRGA